MGAALAASAARDLLRNKRAIAPYLPQGKKTIYLHNTYPREEPLPYARKNTPTSVFSSSHPAMTSPPLVPGMYMHTISDREKLHPMLPETKRLPESLETRSSIKYLRTPVIYFLGGVVVQFIAVVQDARQIIRLIFPCTLC